MRTKEKIMQGQTWFICYDQHQEYEIAKVADSTFYYL